MWHHFSPQIIQKFRANVPSEINPRFRGYPHRSRKMGDGFQPRIWWPLRVFGWSQLFPSKQSGVVDVCCIAAQSSGTMVYATAHFLPQLIWTDLVIKDGNGKSPIKTIHFMPMVFSYLDFSVPGWNPHVKRRAMDWFQGIFWSTGFRMWPWPPKLRVANFPWKNNSPFRNGGDELYPLANKHSNGKWIFYSGFSH